MRSAEAEALGPAQSIAGARAERHPGLCRHPGRTAFYSCLLLAAPSTGGLRPGGNAVEGIRARATCEKTQWALEVNTSVFGRDYQDPGWDCTRFPSCGGLFYLEAFTKLMEWRRP